MRSLFLNIAAATALCAPVAASAADIYGVWVRDGHPTDKLEFFDCQGKLCAKGVLPMLDGSPPPLVLRQAAKTGPNSWKGDLFNPEDGKTYTGKITYDSPTQLTLTGCLVAFLCQSETWMRVSGPPKAAAPADAKGDAKSDKATKAPAADSAKAADKPSDKASAPAKPADKAQDKSSAPAKAVVGQDALKPGKPPKPTDAKPDVAKPAVAKPAVAKPAAPAKPAPAKPAPKPAADDD